jgi:hypothetical protein
MHHYEPGDRVYVFGFSRGAFTARGLAGLTYRAGLMRPGAENLVGYLVSAYTKGDRFTEEDWEVMSQFGDTFAQETDDSKAMPIHFLGLWDSVKALGWFRWDPKWPFTRQLPNARRIRHAVSIDEKRRPYAEYQVEATEKSDVAEVWFAGVHSDVGGTFVDDGRLSRIALKWMADEARAAGLLVQPKAYAKRCTVAVEDAMAVVHRMSWIWGLLTYRRRPIPAGSILHASVRERSLAATGSRSRATSTPSPTRNGTAHPREQRSRPAGCCRTVRHLSLPACGGQGRQTVLLVGKQSGGSGSAM